VEGPGYNKIGYPLAATAIDMALLIEFGKISDKRTHVIRTPLIAKKMLYR